MKKIFSKIWYFLGSETFFVVSLLIPMITGALGLTALDRIDYSVMSVILALKLVEIIKSKH